jgi:hypothetical protein
MRFIRDRNGLRNFASLLRSARVREGPRGSARVCEGPRGSASVREGPKVRSRIAERYFRTLYHVYLSICLPFVRRELVRYW